MIHSRRKRAHSIEEKPIGDMLGRGIELPHGCESSGVTTEVSVIFATYPCRHRRAVLVLVRSAGLGHLA